MTMYYDIILPRITYEAHQIPLISDIWSLLLKASKIINELNGPCEAVCHYSVLLIELGLVHRHKI